jgi:ketosteroid isomerase-like protein
MKHLNVLIVTIALFSLVSCQQGKKQTEQYKAEVAEELSKQNTLYFEAWQNKDLDSVLYFLAPDFINMPSYGMANNVDECRKSFRDVFEKYSIEGVKYERTECFVDCDYAFEVGLFEQKWITLDKTDTISSKLRGMTVFKKQPDGKWKMFRLIIQQ